MECRPDRNVKLEGVGKHSSQRVLARRLCKVHHAFLSAQAINRSNRSLGCPLCPDAAGRGTATKASSYAKRVDALVRVTFRGATFITEARWLKGFNGGMDMTIEGTNTAGKPFTLDVEIDGEQHFKKPMRNKAFGEQREIDMRKDQLALAAGRRLLRLHYVDRRTWAKTIVKAQERLEREPSTAWVMYTNAYSNPM